MKLKNMNYMRRFANMLSELTFWWLNWLPILGYKRPIEIEDLGKIPHQHQAKEIHDKFREAYQNEKVVFLLYFYLRISFQNWLKLVAFNCGSFFDY